MSLTFTRNHQEGALARYVHEHCSPLIITISTAQAESTCLRNGLLFHELLAAFSQLDNIQAQVRMGTHNVPLPDTHVRFERSSELRPRYGSGEGDMLEAHLRGVFQPADVVGLPSTLADVARGVNSNVWAEGGTTGWSQKVEDGFISSMAHSEVCLTSQPSGLVAVVSTADVDPVACMQELLSAHHTPLCMSSGQYDGSPTSVPRGYCLLHDGSESPGSSVEVQIMLQQLRAALPQGTVHLLVINSLPNINIAQPDIWSRWLRPRWFSRDIPAIDQAELLPLNPNSGKSALGCRLSMEDCMALRNLCHSLFTSLALPALERRAWGLGRTVAESRRGVKNFFKGFLRKPRDRDEVPAPHGGPRYPLDRLEAQTLLLADTCFSIGDFENAAQHYRSVRDDFRADKSNAHLLHCTLMLALCHCHLQPNNVHERREYLDTISQLLYATHTQQGTPNQLVAYYALLGSELYVAPKRANLRSPNEAAQLLLQAAQIYAYSPPVNSRGSYVNTAAGGSLLISALLTERAALLLLQAGKVRHFAMHAMVAGSKYQTLPLPWRSQASLCFASALLLYETGSWGGIKSKLITGLLEDVSNVHSRGPEVAKRAFLLMIRALEHCLSGRGRTTSSYAYEDALALLASLSSAGPWGQVRVADQRSDAEAALASIDAAKAATQGAEEAGSFRNKNAASSGLPKWASITTRDALAAPFSEFAQFANVPADADACISIVEGLSLPEIDRRALTFLVPVNGLNASRPLHVQPGKELEYMHMRSNVHKRLKSDFLTEMQWEQQRQDQGQSAAQTNPSVSPSASTGSSILDAPPATSGMLLAQDGSGAAALVPLGLLFAQTEAESQRIAKKEASKTASIIGSRARVPLGEPIVVQLTLKNKLSGALQLTHIRLECLDEDRNVFAANETACSVAANGKASVIVSAVPARLGSFRLPAVTWRIGTALEVRQRLLMPGSLLHDTLDQRARRARAPAVSLNFEVIEPHPLLELRWEGGLGVPSTAAPNDAPECYEGELLWTVLVLENLGGCTACKIQLKLDRPVAAWYTRTEAPDLTSPSSSYDETRLSTFGQSGTLTVLPDSITIPPQQTVRLGAFVRFPKAGHRSLHVLASYSGLRQDGEIVAFGPGTRCRTSYRPRTVTVLPSAALRISISEQCVSKAAHAAAAAQKTLMIHMRNKTHCQPSSSIETAADAADGALQVDTVVSMGSLATAGQPAAQTMYHARRSEAVSICLPVAVLDPRKSSVCTMFTSSNGNSDESTHPSSEGMTVLCRLLGLQRSWEALAHATADARLAVEADELDLQTKGPKSIQSVRREAQAKAQSDGQDGNGDTFSALNTSGYDDADGMGGGERDSVYDDYRDDRSSFIFKRRNSIGHGAFSPTSAGNVPSADNDAGPGKQVLALLNGKGGARSAGTRTSASQLTDTEKNSRARSDSFACDDALAFTSYADTAAVLAHTEARQQTTALAVFWTVTVSTAAHRRVSGVHWVLSVPVLGAGCSTSTPASTVTTTVPPVPGSATQGTGGTSGGAAIVDSLLVNLQHASQATLPAGTSLMGGQYRHRSVRLPVKLNLRSVCKDRMYVSVTALPFGSSEHGLDLIHNDKVLRWQGKCSYLDVPLEPGQEEELPFGVVVNGEGLFDLNRFDIQVRCRPTCASAAAGAIGQAPASAAFEKELKQQSLVSVSGGAQ